MSTKIYNMKDIWDDSSVQYTSIKMNALDYSSDVRSHLMDLKRNGLSQLTVDKFGKIITGTLDIPRVNSLEESITALSAAGLAHVDIIAANLQILQANTTMPNNSIGMVYNDPVLVNNDWYYFVDASNTWANTGLLPKLSEQMTPRKSVDRTFYVSMAGNDTDANTFIHQHSANGMSIYKPFQTIPAALKAANSTGVPCVIIVHPGEYEVAPHTEIPKNCALYGYDARVTRITMADTGSANNLFLLDSGSKIRGFTFDGLEHESSWLSSYNGSLDYGPPKKGYAFAFKPGAYITRSPYIGDCAVLHKFTYQEMSLPQDRDAGNPLMPTAGGNLYADGSVCDPDSPLRSVVVDSFTAVNPNGIAYAVVDNALVQLVSVFTNWSRVGIWAHAGGQVTVVNSNATFGDYAFASTGFRYIVRIDGVPNADTVLVDNATFGNYIKTNVDDIVNTLMSNNTIGYPTIPTYNTVIAANAALANLTSRDTKTILLETADDIISGQDAGTRFWVQSLFTANSASSYSANSAYVFNPSYTSIFTGSYGLIRNELKRRTKVVGSGGNSTANTMIDALFDLAIDVVTTPDDYTVVFPSKIEAASHQFSYAGSGVNYNALPFGQRATGQPTDPTTNLYQSNGGIIYATFNTEQGDTYLGKDLRVDFERSTIEGQAFSRGVQNITLPLIIGIGG